MIEWLGQKRIKLSTITFPGGFAARKKQPHVVQLAESIANLGGRPINLPVVRQLPDKRLPVAGRDRLAAAFINDDSQALVELVRCSDDEAELMAIDEDLKRRHGDDYDKLIKRRVELTTKTIEKSHAEIVEEIKGAAKRAGSDLPAKLTGKSEAKPEPRAKGRPESAKGKAIKEVAKASGKSTEAVRQAVKRADAKEKAAGAPPPGPLPPPVETWDLPIDAKTEAEEFPVIRTGQAALDEVEGLIKSAMRKLAALKDGPKLHQVLYSKTWSTLHSAADAVRRASLDAICPYCGGPSAPNLRAKCSTGCGSTGYVSKEGLANIDAQLKKRGASKVVPDGAGGFMPIAEARAGKSKAPARLPVGNRKLDIQYDGEQPPADAA